MKLPKDPIAVVEASYDLADDADAWLGRLVTVISREIGLELGASAIPFDASGPPGITFDRPVQTEDAPPLDTAPALAAPMMALLDGTGPTMASASQQTGLGEAFARGPGQGIQARVGASDVLAWVVTDPTRRGIIVLAPLRRVATVTPAARDAWTAIGAHVASGLRLRRSLAQADEAVLTPSGQLVHAEGPAVASGARARLREAVRAQERARGPLRHHDRVEALGVWRGLVAGRWSLVERFDSDGKRFLVARRNDPEVRDPRGLTLRERQVLGWFALGRSNKEVAYLLGLAPSTVSAHLASALRKLGLQSRGEAARLLSGREPR